MVAHEGAGDALSLTTERLRGLSRGSAVAIFLVLILFRLPNVAFHGRMWAEEGSVYFASAFTSGWYGGLTHLWGDYFNLWANIAATAAAQTVPLEHAPIVMLVFALVAQAMPILVLALLSETALVPVVAALLIAVIPMGEEVWLNTINSQVHLLLASGFILALPTPLTKSKRAFCYGLLLITSLSSPAGIVVAALLGVRAVLDRSPPRAWQAVATGAGASVQCIIIILMSFRPGRTVGIDPSLLAGVICVKHVFAPFLGIAVAHKLGTLLQQLPVAKIALLLLGGATFIAALTVPGRSTRWRWLFIFTAAIMVVSYVGAYGNKHLLLVPNHGERYYFAPAAALSVVIIGIATDAVGPVRWLAAALVVWSGLIGIAGYVTPDPRMAQGPNWRDEVAIWRENPRHPIAIWPSGWRLNLSARLTTAANPTASRGAERDQNKPAGTGSGMLNLYGLAAVNICASVVTGCGPLN